MNETERQALVDELAEAMWLSGRDDTEGHEWHGDVRETGIGRMILREARACMPIIDRLLAAADAPKQLSVEFACGSQEYWDLEPDGSLRIDIPHDRVVVSSTDLDDAPGLDAGYDKGLSDGYVAGLESARSHIATMKKPLDMYQISHEIGQEIRSYQRNAVAQATATQEGTSNA